MLPSLVRKMPTATLHAVKLASSTRTETVEGGYYFPREDIEEKYFKPSSANTHTTCGWKGVASYLDVHLEDGTVVKDAAWFYPQAKERAKNIEGYVSFYKNKIKVEA